MSSPLLVIDAMLGSHFYFRLPEIFTIHLLARYSYRPIAYISLFKLEHVLELYVLVYITVLCSFIQVIQTDNLIYTPRN